MGAWAQRTANATLMHRQELRCLCPLVGRANRRREAPFPPKAAWQKGCFWVLQTLAGSPSKAPETMELSPYIRTQVSRLMAPLACWLAMLFALPPQTWAGEVAVAWDPPQDASGVSSYVVRYGTASGHYEASTNVGARTSAILSNLQGGMTYYFTANSVSASGEESVSSNEVSVEVPGPPPQPTGAANVSFAQNTTSPAYPFWLSELNGSTNWVLLAQSSNPDLIAPANIALSGTGSNRFVRLTPQPDQRGTSVITLLATDFILTNSTSFQAEVTPPNLAPVVDAGAGTTVRTNLNYMLRGRATDDSLPRTPGRLALRWSKVSGPGTVTFGNSNFAVTSVRLGSPGLYRLRLTAFDGELTSSSDTIIRALLLSDTTPPVIANFTVIEVTSTSISVSWSTDEPADDQLKFTIGDALPKFSWLNPTPRTNHLVILTNLNSDTPYTLIGRSRDSSANQSFSDPLIVRTLSGVLITSPVRTSEQRSTTDRELTPKTVDEGLRPGDEDPASELRITLMLGTGWNLISCPVTAQVPILSDLLPNPPDGTYLLKWDSAADATATNYFSGGQWLDVTMPLQAGEGGYLYNPGLPYPWTLSGTVRPLSSASALERTAQGSLRFLGLPGPYSGLLTSLLPGFRFQEGDQVRRLRVDTGTYETSRYDGHTWDIVPTINIGEGVILDLSPSNEVSP